MKKAAIRYAELLETGCFITHQEQDEIAKLLRRLAMTEDEAWDELETKLNKQKKEKQITNREVLQIAFNALVEIDKQTPYPIAKHAIMVISQAIAQPEQEKESTAQTVDPRLLLGKSNNFTKETENRLCDIERRLAAIETQSAPPRENNNG